MHIEVITEIFIAMFAVYGVYCLVELLCELFFPPRSFVLAVYAKRGESEQDIYARLCYARLIAARERGAKIYPILIADDSFAENEEKLEKLSKMGAAIYTVKEL